MLIVFFPAGCNNKQESYLVYFRGSIDNVRTAEVFIGMKAGLFIRSEHQKVNNDERSEKSFLRSNMPWPWV